MRNYSGLPALLILLLCFHLAGCDSSEEEESLFGTYRATHFNGQSLPAEETRGLFILGITGGSLVLRSNMTFGYSLDLYIIDMGSRTEETEEDSGEFTLIGNRIEFLDSTDRYSGTIRANVIDVDFAVNFRVTYEKK